MSPTARMLPDGRRLHLQHGPIDLVIDADGPARAAALAAAAARFETVLAPLVEDLPRLQRPVPVDGQGPMGEIAQQMVAATAPFAPLFITPMAAVAGAVADAVLAAMQDAGTLTRAYVNNGGDIALHLAPGATFKTAIMAADGTEIGRIALGHTDSVRGIATSGRSGRSHSLGIADSVTVLARTAAAADAAATLIANAVDLPGHPAIRRAPADTLDDLGGLGARRVVTGCARLAGNEIATALAAGVTRAQAFFGAGLIASAALHLQGETRLVGASSMTTIRRLTHA
jgi:ApbE superfamily uncharacterized protein (UPF0280 family)